MNEKFAPVPADPPETFDALRQRIRDRFPSLSPHLQRIARASLEEPNGFAVKTTPVIAGELGIQPSTLIRFAKEFGYSGFSELQKIFRQRLIEGQANVRDRVLERDEAMPPPDARATLEACIAAQRESLQRLSEDCDCEAVARAIQLLRPARHIYVAGLRRSRPMADYFHYGLIRGERASSLLDFAGGMAGPQIATIGPDDVLFAIAFPPYSQPVVDAVMDAHVSGRRIVSLTDGPHSPLAAHAEVALFLDTGAESRLQPVSGAMALIQTLVTAITRP
ncbi:MurR/RpiR family transcriptional regulator [Roseibacterium sp. SDUM158017]|uniref:MurR/RpiR family transcriptional regulator n=1 Tax=Roseicyclus salinarum TaxID=3036773 RepID=UPI0024157382|nr:MurR/RpiR family transcriptional regulator [Roseibacterium sp. SDUM158017]MDG4647885.1 MurR/RpiR family transcriptional regulator [Roseibacterium sp. SDUM158017]